MSKLRPTDPPVRDILGPQSLDHVAQALITLTQEVWVLTDRVLVMEKLLENNGIPAGAIDAYQPDEALTLKLDAARQNLLNKIVDTLKGE